MILQNLVEAMNNRRFASVALLSIILPMSLLAAFRLTGVLPEPPRLETIAVEPVAWSISRPVEMVTFDRRAENFFRDSVATLNFSVRVQEYFENELGFPSYGDDVLPLRIIATADVSRGFIYSVVVRFSYPDTLSGVVFEQTPSSMELRSLEIKKILNLGTYNREAYFETAAVNQPKNSLLSIFAYWVLFDENNVDHAITATLEATYFNGTTYQKAILPICMKVWLDAGDSFETAKMMPLSIRQFNESLGEKNDFEDYYALQVKFERARIKVILVPPSSADFDLYIYCPRKELVANSTLRRQGAVEEAVFTIDSDGFWYIRVADPIRLGEHGTYMLTITTTV